MNACPRGLCDGSGLLAPHPATMSADAGLDDPCPCRGAAPVSVRSEECATIEVEETTSDTSGGIKCPYCGDTITDLWDYAWGCEERIEIECCSCDKPIALRKVVSVDFYASAVLT